MFIYWSFKEGKVIHSKTLKQQQQQQQQQQPQQQQQYFDSPSHVSRFIVIYKTKLNNRFNEYLICT